MKLKNILQHALINSLVAVAYIALVVVIITTVGEQIEPENNYVGPTLFLLLFVISAAVMGITIFGRPILWYLDGLKQEAVKLLISTLGCLVAIALLFTIIVIVQSL